MNNSMNNFIKRIFLALSLGYIFFFFSELVFWSFWRPTNTVGEYALTWLFYSVLAYIFLLIVHEFKVRNLLALFLAGAAFGWLGEGVVAMTFFGAEGVLLPFTISWTGLGWHALISVLLGWYYIQKFLAEGKAIKIISLNAGFGLFWGFWAHTWTLETPPIVTTVSEFAIFAFITTSLFITGHILYGRLSAGTFHPSKIEKIFFSLIAALFFVLVTVPAQPILAPFVLLPLFLLLYFALRKNKLREAEPGLTRIAVEPIPFKRYLLIFFMPAVATPVYGVLFPLAPILWPNFVVFSISTFLGFAFLFVSLFHIFYPKNLEGFIPKT